MNASLRVLAAEPLGLSTPISERMSGAALLTLLAPALARLALRYERDRQGCSELQQELLIALWLSTGTSERRVSLRTWVSTLAHEAGAPEVTTLTREHTALLLALLENLQRKERETVLLSLQNFDAREIAVALHCSPGQAEDTLWRAQRRLQGWMKRREDSGSEPPPVSLLKVRTR